MMYKRRVAIGILLLMSVLLGGVLASPYRVLAQEGGKHAAAVTVFDEIAQNAEKTKASPLKENAQCSANQQRERCFCPLTGCVVQR